MAGERINPWVRADLETFNVETLNLVPDGLREDYTRIMKELAHARAIANLAIERMYSCETERRAFFDYVIGVDNVVDLGAYRKARNGTRAE